MQKKYVIVTGASRGIGEKTLERFQKEDWEIINISRTASAIPSVTQIQLDLADLAAINTHKNVLQEVIPENSQICLVHNAAFYKPDKVDTLQFADVERTFNVNIFAAMLLNQMFIPLMLPDSVIIYIGTTLSTKGVPGSASYSISKHAQVGLMRATCQDLMPKKIRSLCICPGLVNTRLLHETMSQELLTHLLNTQVMGQRLIEPQEIANIIYFCATNPAINGEVIHANLGLASD